MACCPDLSRTLVPAELLGITLNGERLHEVVAAYAPIWAEICKLRELDLSKLQPAVVFRARQAWEEAGARDA